MFGMKTHYYVDGPGHNEMGKFLKEFIPLLIIKKTNNLILKSGDEEIHGGKIYEVLCTDKMAKVIDRRFGLHYEIWRRDG